MSKQLLPFPPETIKELYTAELMQLPKERLVEMIVNLKDTAQTLRGSIDLMKDFQDERGYN